MFDPAQSGDMTIITPTQLRSMFTFLTSRHVREKTIRTTATRLEAVDCSRMIRASWSQEQRFTAILYACLFAIYKRRKKK